MTIFLFGAMLFLLLLYARLVFDNVNCHISYSSLLHIIFFLTPFFLITVSRDIYTGVDTIRYYFEYASCQHGCVIRGYEPLFSHLITFLNYLGIEFRGFLIMQGLVFYAAIALVYSIGQFRRLYSAIVFILFILIFGIFDFGLSGIRQSIAISIFLLSIPLLLKGYYMLYFLFGFLAFLIHNSAIFPFVFCFFIVVLPRVKLKWLLFSVLVSPLSLLFGNSLVEVFYFFDLKQTVNIVNYEDQTINYKTPILFYFISMAMVLTVWFLPQRYWFYKVGSEFLKDRFFYICMWSLLICCCILWLATSVRLFERFAFYFYPLAGSVLLCVEQNIKNSLWLLLAKAVTVFMLLFIYLYILFN